MNKIYYSAKEHGFFSELLHQCSLPNDVVEITVLEHQALLDGQTAGGQIRAGSDGKPYMHHEPVVPSHDIVKSSLKAQVDASAETERLRFITPGTGQAMTYQRKVEEANRMLEDIVPAPENYPLLAASVGIDGESIAAVAAVVLAMDAAWAQIGAAIEHIRLTAKKAIEDAADEATARAVVEQLAWPEITT